MTKTVTYVFRRADTPEYLEERLSPSGNEEGRCYIADLDGDIGITCSGDDVYIARCENLLLEVDGNWKAFSRPKIGGGKVGTIVGAATTGVRCVLPATAVVK